MTANGDSVLATTNMAAGAIRVSFCSMSKFFPQELHSFPIQALTVSCFTATTGDDMIGVRWLHSEAWQGPCFAQNVKGELLDPASLRAGLHLCEVSWKGGGICDRGVHSPGPCVQSHLRTANVPAPVGMNDCQQLVVAVVQALKEGGVHSCSAHASMGWG
jgi:hypothetical protein